MKVYTRLFSYGRLQKNFSPPHGADDFEPDMVHGFMFELHPKDALRLEDPGITAIGNRMQPLVHGQTMRISLEDLRKLDKIERGYQRKLVTTEKGHRAWIYEWLGHVPVDAEAQTIWRPRRLTSTK